MGTNDIEGFTLLELMVAMSVFAILILVVYGTFFSQYSRMNHQMNQATMTTESTRVIDRLMSVIEDANDLSLSRYQIRDNGRIMVDCDSDLLLEGAIFSLDRSKKQLIDADGGVIASHVEGIEFVEGPITYDQMYVAEGVIMAVVTMNDGGSDYVVKGGINIEK